LRRPCGSDPLVRQESSGPPAVIPREATGKTWLRETAR